MLPSLIFHLIFIIYYLSRHFHLIDNTAHNFLACHLTSLSLIRETDTMAKHVVCHGTNILWDDIATMLDESICTSSLRKRDAGTWTTTKGDHILQVAQAITLWITRSKDNVGDILLYLLVDIHLVDYAASLQNLISCSNRCHSRHAALDVFTNNQLLLLQRRIVDDYLEQETIDLCLRQLIGSLLLDWVLGSHHQEWVRQLECLLTDGNLMFLHRLQQSTLYLGWSTVDLICQNEVGKDRSLLDVESLILLGIDLCTTTSAGNKSGVNCIRL